MLWYVFGGPNLGMVPFALMLFGSAGFAVGAYYVGRQGHEFEWRSIAACYVGCMVALLLLSRGIMVLCGG